MWGVRAEIQVSKRELHTHIQLDYAKVETLSCIKKKKKIHQIYIYIFPFFSWKNFTKNFLIYR